MDMDLEALFGGFSLARFVEDHLHRLPFAAHGTVSEAAELANWPLVESIAAREHADVLLVGEGVTRSVGHGTSTQELQAALHDGWTIRVRRAQQHSDEIRRLAGSFENAFRGAVDVHLYVTPPGKQGLSWHYDAEDVFILQAAGEKEYLLRKNTINPWPLAETMPLDLRYERELMPLARVLLGAGDLLYIPCGYWHRTESPVAASGAAISLAIGVMSRAAIDLLPLMRSKFLESLAWRQRLPVGQGADARGQMEAIVAQLTADVARTLRSPTFVDEALQWQAEGHGE